MVREFLFCSLLLWQIGFIIGILLKLFYKPSEKKFVPTVAQTIPAVEVRTPKVQPGHIDIEMKKNIAVQKPTKSSIKSDEVIKGKVKTQKDKLKQLRRG
jgi:uncharacterized membrane protein YraQ (UPF0718 family)